MRGGVLRVGIIEHRPWTIVEGDHVSGVEPQLIGAWAGELGARVEWHRGHIEALVDALHRHEIDVLAAGWYVATPYARQLALSQPYVEIRDDQQKTQALALAVSPGESALLFSLDRFLATQDDASILAAASAFQVSQRR